MEKMLDIGDGLKIAKVNIEELREQDLNARSMNSNMFERLTANIKKDHRLESLPFCAETEKGIEIISGHHRVRACRSAGITDIFIILDDTGMSRNKIRSKQLSHNSIQGDDNVQLVKEIYALIDDAEEKLAAYIDPNVEEMLDKVQTKDVIFDLDIKTILVNFLSYEADTFQKAADKLNGQYDALYVADIKNVEPFTECVKRVGKEYDIRAMNTTFTKMAEIVLEHLGEEVETDERVAIRDIFGTAYIPAEVADELKSVIDKMKKAGTLSNNEKWGALDVMAKAYLGEEE